MLKATITDDIIHLQLVTNPHPIEFFSNLIFTDKTSLKFHEGGANSFNDLLSLSIEKKAVMEYNCSYKTITVGCVNGQTDCTDVSYTISECSWIDSGGRDFESIELIEFGGGGGGGSSSQNPITLINPCSIIKTQTTNANYQNKISELKKTSVLNKPYESGYSEDKQGNFTKLKTSESTSSSDGLKVPINSNTKGYIHTHQNDYETGRTDGDNNPEIRKPIRIFSPADVNALMEIAKQRTNQDYSDIYATMVSSDGTYMLKFTGGSSDIKTGFGTREWRIEFRNYIIREKGPLVAKFLGFVSKEMKINNIALFKLKDSGSIQEIKLNPSIPNRIITSDCP